MSLCLRFSREHVKNGKKKRHRTGDAEVPPRGATDVHFAFPPNAGAVIKYKYRDEEGDKQDTHSPPKGKEVWDVGVEFDINNDGDIVGLGDSYWTDVAGEPIGDFIAPPDGATEWVLEVKRINRAYWTKNNKPYPMGELIVPAGASDAHIYERGTEKTSYLQPPAHDHYALAALAGHLIALAAREPQASSAPASLPSITKGPSLSGGNAVRELEQRLAKAEEALQELTSAG